jgi:hypothetical protein
MRSSLIQAGVKHLRDFGYPKCNSDNILTDRIYRAFFVKMLQDTVDDAEANSQVVSAAKALIGEAAAAEGQSQKNL